MGQGGQPHLGAGHRNRPRLEDPPTGEAILFQKANYTHSEWALWRPDSGWSRGQLAWPAHAPTDMAPFGASHARVNYPVVALRNRAVHFCGAAAYDNWDRVKTPADLGLDNDPNAPGASGMAARQRGNRFRRLLYAWTPVTAGEGAAPTIPTDLDQVGRPYLLDNGETILGDAIPTHRFHATPDGRLFVVYYVSDGQALSESRMFEILDDGTPSAPVTLPLKHPLTQFFTAAPRAGCAPSWTLDLLGHRRGGWRPAEGTGGREWEGTLSYVRVRIQ